MCSKIKDVSRRRCVWNASPSQELCFPFRYKAFFLETKRHRKTERHKNKTTIVFLKTYKALVSKLSISRTQLHMCYVVLYPNFFQISFLLHAVHFSALLCPGRLATTVAMTPFLLDLLG